MKIFGYNFNITRDLPALRSGGGKAFVQDPAWVTSYLGPGQPITPITPSNQIEVPRTIDYPISVNAQLTPRQGYGLMPFPQLMLAYEKVPECRFPVNLIHRQLSSYLPRLIDKQGMAVEDHPYQWMCEYPDGVTPFNVWMTRYLKSAKIYDAPALYLEKDYDGNVTGLHFIDGSTLFVILDERGNTPMPERPQEYLDRVIDTYATSVDGVPTTPRLPGATRGPTSIDSFISQYNRRLASNQGIPLRMPAYTQVIKGTPFSWWSADQIWYMPESRRVNSPYGEPFIEAAWPWVMIIVNLTAFELAHYRTGNMPEGYVTLPKDWLASIDQLEAIEVALNQRMTQNPVTERNRIRIFPEGSKWFQTKRGEWPESLYNRARGNILDEIGIPPAEAGDIPGKGLGGKGFKEGGTVELNRNTINPNRNMILTPFNHILKLAGVRDVTMTLEPPIGEIDPDKLKESVYNGMAHGTYSLNDGRSLLSMAPIGDVKDPNNIANLHLIVAGTTIFVIEKMEVSQGMAVPAFTGAGGAAGGPPAGPETAAEQNGAEHTTQDKATINKIMRQVEETGTFDSKFYSIPLQKAPAPDHPRDSHGRWIAGEGKQDFPKNEHQIKQHLPAGAVNLEDKYQLKVTGNTPISEVSDTFDNIIGKPGSLDKAVTALGAKEGDKVTLWKQDDNSVSISIENDKFFVNRAIFKDANGNIRIDNHQIAVYDQGKGLGTKLFSDEVEWAKGIGAKQIDTMARREPDMNGYYTWARLGYDANLKYSALGDKAAKAGFNVEKVSDLMKTPEGTKWWLKNGKTIPMTFDLTPGSHSLSVLEAYNKARSK